MKRESNDVSVRLKNIKFKTELSEGVFPEGTGKTSSRGRGLSW